MKSTFIALFIVLLSALSFAQFNRGDNAIPGAVKVYPGDHFGGSDMCQKILNAVTANPGQPIDAQAITGSPVCAAANATNFLNVLASNGGGIYFGNVTFYADGTANYTDGAGSGVGTPAFLIPNKWGDFHGVSRGGANTPGTNFAICTGVNTPVSGCTTGFPVRSFTPTTTTVVGNTMTINAAAITTSNIYVGEDAQINGSSVAVENRMYKVLTVAAGSITVTVNTGTTACASSCGTLYLGTPVLGVVESATPPYNNQSCAGNCNAFGPRITNIGVNCEYVNGCIGIQDIYGNENTLLDGWVVVNSPFAGLDIHGNVSQHSGPFKNGEIYTGAPRSSQAITSIAVSTGTATITWGVTNNYLAGQFINITGTSVVGCNSRVQLLTATTFNATTFSGTCANATGGSGLQEASCQEGTTAITVGDIDHGPIEDVTFNMNLACQKQALAGAIIDAGNQEISGDSHAEGWTDDILIGFNTASFSNRVVDFSCQVPSNPGVNCIHVSGNFKTGGAPTSDYNFQNVRRQSSTINIQDDILGATINDNFVACYAADWNNAVGFWGLSSCNPAFGVQHPWYKSFPNSGPGTFLTNEGALWMSTATGSPWVFRNGGSSTVYNMAGAASSLGTSGAGTPVCSDGTLAGLSISGCTGGLTNPMTTLGDSLYGGVSGVPTRLAGPTTPNSVPQVWTSIPSGGVATAQTWALPGVAGRAITGTTSTDTILATDCSPNRIEYAGSVAVGITLPTATTLGVAHCVFKVTNDLSTVNSLTITPTTWTINGSATLVILNGQLATIYVDPNSSTNWVADVTESALTAGTNISFTRTASGLTVNTTGVPANIANGTAALGTTAIASGACATAVTVSATGVATTDVIGWVPNADISAVTGYAPVTTGALIIYPYPTANNVNFKVCNPTSASITPAAVTLNWKVVR